MQNEPKHANTEGRPPDSVSRRPAEPAASQAGDIDDIERQEEALLDEAIELTFPASDPISVPSYDEARERSKCRKERAAQQTN
jgi:hypothetical protein